MHYFCATHFNYLKWFAKAWAKKKNSGSFLNQKKQKKKKKKKNMNHGSPLFPTIFQLLNFGST